MRAARAVLSRSNSWIRGRSGPASPVIEDHQASSSSVALPTLALELGQKAAALACWSGQKTAPTTVRHWTVLVAVEVLRFMTFSRVDRGLALAHYVQGRRSGSGCGGWAGDRALPWRGGGRPHR